MRVDPSFRRDMVYRRDRGICAACGTDTKILANRLLRLYWNDRPAWDELRKELGLTRARGSTGSVWDLDHIVAKCVGGEEDLSNYRTLCIPCHRKASAHLAWRQAFGDLPSRRR
jgi:5-methylcytosine-specific restriction protein A